MSAQTGFHQPQARAHPASGPRSSARRGDPDHPVRAGRAASPLCADHLVGQPRKGPAQPPGPARGVKVVGGGGLGETGARVWILGPRLLTAALALPPRTGHGHHHRLRGQGAPDVGREDHRLLLLRLRHLLLRAPSGRCSSWGVSTAHQPPRAPGQQAPLCAGSPLCAGPTVSRLLMGQNKRSPASCPAPVERQAATPWGGVLIHIRPRTHSPGAIGFTLRVCTLCAACAVLGVRVGRACMCVSQVRASCVSAHALRPGACHACTCVLCVWCTRIACVLWILCVCTCATAAVQCCMCTRVSYAWTLCGRGAPCVRAGPCISPLGAAGSSSDGAPLCLGG